MEKKEIWIEPDRINPHFDLEQLLNDSSIIKLIFNYKNIENFDDKLGLFLKTYGHKVKTLTKYNPNYFDIKKFVHLMPNLEVIYCNIKVQDNDTEIFLDDFQNCSIPLKKLYVLSDLRVGWKVFKIFDIEEFEIKGDFEVDENLIEFFSCCKNLKKLIISNLKNSSILLEILPTNELELIDLCVVEGYKEEVILNFLQTQKYLKSIKFSPIHNEVFSFICDNFKNLECLKLRISKNISRKNFEKLNNLKSLKSLEFRSSRDICGDIKHSWTFYLPNLEHFCYDSSTKYLVQYLASNCKNLKSLELSAYQCDYEEVLIEALKSFNQLESLSIMAKGLLTNQTISEDFYLISHFNSNLKTLKVSIELFDPFKLKQKITRDFPNLENYPDDKQKRFFKYHEKKDSKYFEIDLSSEENINEKLKDCSVYFDPIDEDINGAQCNRDGKKEIWIEPERYFNDQQLKTILTTTRKLKEISIVPNANHGSNAILHYIAYLKSINENVTILTFKEFFPLEMCHKIIKIFPNLKVLKLEILGIDSIYENDIFEIKNPKLEEFHFIIYDRDRQNSYENHFQNFKIFCKDFRFKNDSLKKFKFVSKSFFPN
ncbi:hypothetical protein PVAND_016750 [Polypedilum vanderplanki]|uniref:Uncharacterized protein n=1 Tax=Polypedilum vanderplanki TaxID=319348 RepID=A0A9J6BH39_POLVA|nr:hypothetical protein PVAND_016750 [Polypedilum vanderplanki]